MMVYVVEHFTDHEGSQFIKAFNHKEDALAFCKQKIGFVHENIFHKDENEEIEELPTGYRTGDEGYIYNEMEVE